MLVAMVEQSLLRVSHSSLIIQDSSSTLQSLKVPSQNMLQLVVLSISQRLQMGVILNHLYFNLIMLMVAKVVQCTSLIHLY
jgi:hypothetical protein